MSAPLIPGQFRLAFRNMLVSTPKWHRDRYDDTLARSRPAQRWPQCPVAWNARRVKAALQMQLNKTDENDAEGLAQIMRTVSASPSEVP